MKTLMALILAGLPAGAQAMGMAGGMGMHGGGMRLGGFAHGAVALYAILAALGYWVLQHAGKQEDKLIRRTGATVATVLIAVGLLGVLCGVVSHVKSSIDSACRCQAAVEMTHSGAGKPMQIDVKVTEAGKPK